MTRRATVAALAVINILLTVLFDDSTSAVVAPFAGYWYTKEHNLSRGTPLSVEPPRRTVMYRRRKRSLIRGMNSQAITPRGENALLLNVLLAPDATTGGADCAKAHLLEGPTIEAIEFRKSCWWSPLETAASATFPASWTPASADIPTRSAILHLTVCTEHGRVAILVSK